MATRTPASLPAPAANTVNDGVRKFVALWEPAPALEMVATAQQVQFIKDTVNGAAPRNTAEARNGLRWGLEFIVWMSARTDKPLSADWFSKENVDRYKASLSGATGSLAAMSSHLRRLHPEIGFAGTTRVSPATTASAEETFAESEPACAQVSAVRATPMEQLPTEVIDAVTGFSPQQIRADLWNATSALVRSVVLRTKPAQPGRARDLCRSVSYLAAWVASQHRPITAEVVLAGATIEEFLNLIEGAVTERSLATISSNLHLVREANEITYMGVRRQFARPAVSAPYSASEQDELWAAISQIPRSNRRRYARALYILVLGVGANSADTIAVRTDAVIIDEQHKRAWVPLLGRVEPVPVLPALYDALVAARNTAVEHGDEFLIGGNGTSSNRPNGVLRGRGMATAVDLDIFRARSTWLVEAATSEHLWSTPAEFLQATGQVTFRQLGELADDIEARLLDRNDRRLASRLELVQLAPDETSTETHDEERSLREAS